MREWISVDEKLPERAGLYEVRIRTGGRGVSTSVGLAEYTPTEGWKGRKVIAWRNLPHDMEVKK